MANKKATLDTELLKSIVSICINTKGLLADVENAIARINLEQYRRFCEIADELSGIKININKKEGKI